MENRKKLFLFDIICVVFFAFFIFVRTKVNIYDSLPLVVGSGILLLLGLIYFFIKRNPGFSTVFPTLFITIISLPMAGIGLLLLGPYMWFGIIASVVVMFFLCFVFGFWRGIFLGVMAASAVFILLINPILSGALGANCPYVPEAVRSTGGIVIEDHGAGALVCGDEPGVILAASPQKGQISLNSISLGEIMAVNFSPGAPKVLGKGQSLAVAYDGSKKTVSVLDVKYLSEYQKIELTEYECRPGSITVSRLYMRTLMTCVDSGKVQFLDTIRGFPIHETDRIISLPYGVKMNQALDRAYLSDLFGSNVVELDIETMSPVRAIKIGYSQTDMAVSEKGDLIYIARPFSSTVDVINSRSRDRITSLKAPLGVTKIALDDKGQRLFAVAFATGKLHVIDLNNPENYKEASLGSQVRDMTYCPNSDLIFYSTYCSVYYLDPGRL